MSRNRRIYELHKYLDELNVGDEDYKSELECVICTEYISDTYIVNTCGHIFHMKCLTKYFKNKDNCPVCKADSSDLIDSIKFRFIKALMTNNIKIINALNSSGIDLDISNQFFIKSIIQKNNIDALKAFIDMGYKADTEFMIDIMKECSSEAYILLLNSIEMQEEDTKNLSFNMIKNDKPDILDAFIQNKNITIYDAYILCSYIGDKLECMKILHKYGGDINLKGGFLLYAAIQDQKPKFESYLRENGVILGSDTETYKKIYEDIPRLDTEENTVFGHINISRLFPNMSQEDIDELDNGNLPQYIYDYIRERLP